MVKKINIFILLGILALLSDFTYEGGRSIIGPILGSLGAPLIIAASTSIGEFLSYGSRILSGYITLRIPKSSVYWILIFTGYALNLFTIPLIGYTDQWTIIFTLILLERIGKGIRTPIKDVLVAETGEELGYGYSYSIHEFMDQAGAVLGPLYIGLALGTLGVGNTYLFLFIPAALAMTTLYLIYYFMPEIEAPKQVYKEGGLNHGRLIPYLIGVSFSTMIMIHWIHGSYRFEGLPPEYISFLYLTAMLVDAFSALILGFLYQNISKYSLLIMPILTGISTVSIINYGDPLTYSIIWGFAMGGIESIYKAYLAEMVEPMKRGFAFGILSLSIGGGLFIGNIAYVYLNPAESLTYTLIIGILSTASLYKSIKSRV